jgi:drug/metabolite transporter (DMT)-like permease
MKEAIASFSVLAFVSLRFLAASVGILPLAIVEVLRYRRSSDAGVTGRWLKSHLVPGLVTGILFWAGYAFQTLGLDLTTPSKTGFITGIQVVLVPVIAGIVLHQRPRALGLVGLLIAFLGLYLLSFVDLSAGGDLVAGDVLVLCAALLFAGHIVAISTYAPRVNSLVYTAVQLCLVLVANTVLTLSLEGLPDRLPSTVLVTAAWTGFVGITVVLVAQVWAQRYTPPLHVGLLLATEPIFAASFAYVLIGERLGHIEVFGCGLILLGMVVAEVDHHLRVPTIGGSDALSTPQATRSEGKGAIEAATRPRDL